MWQSALHAVSWCDRNKRCTCLYALSRSGRHERIHSSSVCRLPSHRNYNGLLVRSSYLLSPFRTHKFRCANGYSGAFTHTYKHTRAQPFVEEKIAFNCVRLCVICGARAWCVCVYSLKILYHYRWPIWFIRSAMAMCLAPSSAYVCVCSGSGGGHRGPFFPSPICHTTGSIGRPEPRLVDGGHHTLGRREELYHCIHGHTSKNAL